MIPVHPSLMCFFNMGNIEGTNSSKNCLMLVYGTLYFVFMEELVLGIDLRKFVYIYIHIHIQVTLCG